MKDAYYFSHDSNARHDPKISALCSKYGLIAYAYFFQLIEILREQDGFKLDESLFGVIANAWQSYGNAINLPLAKEILFFMKSLKLIEIDDGKIHSSSLDKRMGQFLNLRRVRSEAGKKGAMAKWQTSGKPMAVKESKVKKRKDKDMGDFDQFWSEYPKHRARPAAERAWKKLSPSVDLLKVILDSIEKFKVSDNWQKENGQFIPYPASWINGRRWEDELGIECEQGGLHPWQNKMLDKINENQPTE